MSERLVLGTAQFGVSYGISNTSGQVSQDEIGRILALARTKGIRTLDTATAYGDSEARIGKAGAEGWRIVTKLLHAAPAEIEGKLRESLKRLNVESVDAVMLHRSSDLLDAEGAARYKILRGLQEAGLLGKVGVSIYDPEEFDTLLARGYRVDIVQAPFNVLDRRLATSGCLGRMRSVGAEIHVRSAFLQGLLLMKPDQRPAKFARWRLLWSSWSSWLERHDASPLATCIQFVMSYPEVNGVVVGVESAKQLEEIIGAANQPMSSIPPGTLSSTDLDLINPSRWGTL